MKKICISVLSTQYRALFIACLSILTAISAQAEIKSAGEIPSGAQKAYVGVFLMNVYDMDYAANSFYADFYLWMKWKGDIDPMADMEFANYVEKWGFTRELLNDTLIVLSDGYKYNIMRVEGRFYYPFKLDRYPLDTQALKIQIENSMYNTNDLVYLQDTSKSGISNVLKIPGWDIEGLSADENVNEYATNFGDPDVPVNEPYSNLTFKLHISRPMSFFLWKLLLPLLVVMISSLGTMLIYPEFIDARISLPIGALLSAVFLQQSYTSSLPDVGYMILMDKIYVLCYVLIISGLIESIITANWASSEEEDDIKRVRRFDFRYIAIAFTILIGGAITIVLTA